MAFFDDMQSALHTYPETNVTLEIVDVTTPGALNVGDVGKFHIKVSNNGPLNLTGVTLKITGLNGATVSPAYFLPRVPEFVSDPLPTIFGHSEYTTPNNPFGFEPSLAWDPEKNLVKVTLEAWDANLDHLLNVHSNPLDTVKAIYAAVVFPQ